MLQEKRKESLTMIDDRIMPRLMTSVLHMKMLEDIKRTSEKTKRDAIIGNTRDQARHSRSWCYDVGSNGASATVYTVIDNPLTRQTAAQINYNGDPHRQPSILHIK